MYLFVYLILISYNYIFAGPVCNISRAVECMVVMKQAAQNVNMDVKLGTDVCR